MPALTVPCYLLLAVLIAPLGFAQLGGNQVLAPLIVVASSSRLNSMAILRLRLCGKLLLDFPDSEDHRFFHYMRHSGMYHYLVEDIPHAVLSVAVLVLANHERGRESGDTMGACAEGDFDLFGWVISHTHVAIASLAVSLGSIVFGIVAKAMQQVTVTIMNDAEAPLLGANQDRLDRGSGFSESVRDIVSRLREEGFRLTKSGRDDAAGGGRELSGAE